METVAHPEIWNRGRKVGSGVWGGAVLPLRKMFQKFMQK